MREEIVEIPFTDQIAQVAADELVEPRPIDPVEILHRQ